MKFSEFVMKIRKYIKNFEIDKDDIPIRFNTIIFDLITVYAYIDRVHKFIVFTPFNNKPNMFKLNTVFGEENSLAAFIEYVNENKCKSYEIRIIFTEEIYRSDELYFGHSLYEINIIESHHFINPNGRRKEVIKYTMEIS